MHNYYTYLYNKAVYDVLVETKGADEAILFARSATVGGQQFPVHWGGDCSSNYPSMAESLRAGLSFGMSGFGYWSHDIAGFEDQASPDLYKRWTQFGLLSSHSRYHGSTAYKVPWLYGDEAVDVAREFTELKLQLKPYLLKMAQETHETGVPMMRAMVLEFPDDPTCEDIDTQYMLGDDLLVARCSARMAWPASTCRTTAPARRGPTSSPTPHTSRASGTPSSTTTIPCRCWHVRAPIRCTCDRIRRACRK